MYQKVRFNSFPTIKYSHYFVKNNYFAKYCGKTHSIEIAYIVNGTLHAKKDGKEIFTATPGSLIIFSSMKNLTLESDRDVIHVHHTIQLECFHDVELFDGEYTGSLLPDNCLILPVCMKCDESSANILQKILSLTKKCSSPREMKNYENIIDVLKLFAEISKEYLKNKSDSPEEPATSAISNKIKKIIAENLHMPLTVNNIAKRLQRSPNYINTVFRQTENITICQYINKEKIMQIINHMSNDHLPFSSACEKVGIYDTSYGYRMFKKITGTTPKLYMQMSFNKADYR